MPNYKVFQDHADSLRTKIYGTDSGGTVRELLTSLDGKMLIQGDIAIDSGDVVTVVNSSGNPLWVKNDVSDPLFIQSTSGNQVYVKNTSGDALYIVNDSGTPFWIKNDAADSLFVTINEHTVVDSGETLNLSGPGSGTAAVHNILNYHTYTYAIKNNYTSGAQTVSLECCALSSGAPDADWVLDGSGVTIDYGGWKFLTSNYLVKFARVNASTTATSSGTFDIYFQAQK